MAKKAEFNLEVAKKYVFWVCTPIGLVAGVLAGLMAIGSVANELEQRKTELNNQKDATRNLHGTARTHVNDKTVASIEEEREKLAENVLEAWEMMVQEQRARNRWGNLGDIFLNEIEDKKFLDPISGVSLGTYLNFARDELNKLLDRNLARPGEPELYLHRVQQFRRNPDGSEEPLDRPDLTTSTGTGGSGRGGGFTRREAAAPSTRSDSTRTTPEFSTITKGKVIWTDPASNISFNMANNWQRTPLPYEVWLTQEDLWVYQALLWVVAESNKNSREASRRGASAAAGVGGGGTRAAADLLNLQDSVVKQIVEMSIGKKAAVELRRQSSRRINRSVAGGGEGGDLSEIGSTAGIGGGDSFSSEGGGGALTPEAARAAALANRYVDADGTPLPTPDLDGQLRRMPVYLRLIVDQRRISEVLVNCANCPMPIDVLWVTINPDAGQPFEYVSATAGSSLGGGMEGGGGSSFVRQERRTAQPGGRSGGGGTGVSDADFGPDIATIEIFGCINIFTPPDPQTLGGSPN